MLPHEVDVAIVGAGSAGCVLAAKLSAAEGRSVALLESGPGYSSVAGCPPELLDPGRLPVGPGAPFVRRYRGELRPSQVTEIVRGRALGGSGAVNGCYFIRGTSADFEGWPQELWSFSQVLPYFRALENDQDFGGEFHGSSGPIPVRRDSGYRLTPLSSEFYTACLDAGFVDEPDKNAPAATAGVGPVPSNIGDGRRISTAIGYLLPVLHRPNLAVNSNTTVTRVLFDADRAIGIDAVANGIARRILAGRIVLCAGAIETAALLMRSGIGDPEQLRSVGVPVVTALPGVGAGFFDHPEVGIPYRPTRVGAVDVPALQVVLNTDDVEFRPYTAPFAELVPGSGDVVQRLGVVLMRPRSRGSVRLQDSDPRTDVSVDYRYLEGESDRAAMHDAVLTGRRLLDDLIRRGVVDAVSPDYSDARFLEHLGTSQHLGGTCRMGRSAADGAVVDARCQVFGVTGLSVVDASIIPSPLRRGPHATIVMMAERAAELIVQEQF
ncbi:mycofactocin system GMC family oxidoreductase MftG [Antrihabitans sp. YC3-6]|uniref:Mycofactocin system GMC family oxidoreductase MftG n=1 Tax=Antrihabitans stalagmiti TaxID=2799499 RepID=A0A934NP77_9NOCA|nr:mycofactocin system GMC family oxidoreductase MftG [Antrihabitans stalagmiti]